MGATLQLHCQRPRATPMFLTLYAKGIIEDQEVTVFLDTGAGLSLISEALC